MSNKEKALALWAIAQDADNYPVTERQEALGNLIELKRTAKVNWAKLGIEGDPSEYVPEDEPDELVIPDDGPTDNDAADPLDEPVEAPEAAKLEVKAKKPKADTDRGLITALTKQLLLTTEDSYQLIVDAVKAKFPKATTTTRSVASVASEMRKAGDKVSSRRTPAATK